VLLVTARCERLSTAPSDLSSARAFSSDQRPALVASGGRNGMPGLAHFRPGVAKQLVAVSRTSYGPTPVVNSSAMMPGHYRSRCSFRIARTACRRQGRRCQAPFVASACVVSANRYNTGHSLKVDTETRGTSAQTGTLGHRRREHTGCQTGC
jgi:hypothetical protein